MLGSILSRGPDRSANLKRKVVINKPLNSNEQAKVLGFILLMVPPAIGVIGIIPAIFLLFGMVMLKRSGDVSYIITAAKLAKAYICVALTILILFLIDLGGEFYIHPNYWDYDSGEFIGLSFMIFLCICYLLFIEHLFKEPIVRHHGWVSSNGIFATKPRKQLQDAARAELDIIKTESLKPYSVADELTKWAKLKDNGHISNEDFNEVRSKLLGR